MKKNIRFLSYLAYLEREMLHSKFVEKIKTYFILHKIFFKKLYCLCYNMEKYD
jgi:hypothetical protein